MSERLPPPGLPGVVSIPLPRDWPELIRRAFVTAVGLERAALLEVRAGFENSPDPRAQLCAELDAAHEQIEILTELARILLARVEHMPAAHRPHYPPQERLAILTLRGRAGWNTTQTADRVGVTPKTIASWMRRLDEQGPGALVQTPKPVNAFDDAVTLLVHHLHDAAPGKGRRKKAELLLRAGLRIADSTVRSMLRGPRPTPAPSPEPAPGPLAAATTNETAAPRVVTAKRPHHVWHVDITPIPIGWAGGGFWVAWWPFALILRWALSWHIALVLDHYSRALLAFRVVRCEPSAADICALLDDAVVRAGTAPNHIVSDQGTQFQNQYRAWCTRHGAKPRFGKVGEHGSIAIIERFIRSLKEELLRRVYIPASHAGMLKILSAYQIWYNEHRPHSSLDGCTPSERLAGAPPPMLRPRIEP
jgi:transposase InsO family protein